MADLERELARLSMFAGVDSDHLRQLARILRPVQYPAGAIVLREGDAGTFGEMGIVLSGRLRVIRGADTVVGYIGPGEFFGEMAVVDDVPRTATLVAEEATNAATLKAWHLRTVIRTCPELAMNLLVTLSRRLREARSGDYSAGAPHHVPEQS